MPTREELIDLYRELSDEELIDRLSSDGNLPLTNEVIQEELTSRGIDLNQALYLRKNINFGHGGSVSATGIVGKALHRIMHFPLRAIFGLEPLWKVVVFGGVAVFILFKLVINGLVTVVVPPIPKFPFAIAYSLIILESLAFIWLGISLWRSGVKIPSIAWKVFAYTAAVLCLLFGT